MDRFSSAILCRTFLPAFARQIHCCDDVAASVRVSMFLFIVQLKDVVRVYSRTLKPEIDEQHLRDQLYCKPTLCKLIWLTARDLMGSPGLGVVMG